MISLYIESVKKSTESSMVLCDKRISKRDKEINRLYERLVFDTNP